MRHTTCATSAWTTPHLATIQHTNNTLPEFAATVNPKRRRACLHQIRGNGLRFILHLIRPEGDNDSASTQSNTGRLAEHGSPNVRLWDFSPPRGSPNERIRTAENVTKEKLSGRAPSVMLRATPGLPPGLGTIPVQINRSKQSKTRFHNVVEAGVVAVQTLQEVIREYDKVKEGPDCWRSACWFAGRYHHNDPGVQPSLRHARGPVGSEACRFQGEGKARLQGSELLQGEGRM
jgi:hypothetical protein